MLRNDEIFNIHFGSGTQQDIYYGLCARLYDLCTHNQALRKGDPEPSFKRAADKSQCQLYQNCIA